MLVVIKSSKTDQYLQRKVVPVARTGIATCQVKKMDHYYELAEIAHDSSMPLFRGVIRTKHIQRLRSAGSLSYNILSPIIAIFCPFALLRQSASGNFYKFWHRTSHAYKHYEAVHTMD